MENTSYALYMVAGFLIAVMILSLVLFRWRQIGTVEKTKDDAVVIKNKTEFNAEYEAFNRTLMYGTDVLSCLNKAQNNNQKYVYNNYYGTDTATIGSSDRAEHFIDVEVTIKSTLCDNVKAYYRDSKGKNQRIIGLTDGTNYKDKVFSNSGIHFDDPTIYYYYFKKGKLYQENKNYTDIMWNTTDKNKTLYKILTEGIGSNQGGQIETKITDNDGIPYKLLDIADRDGTETADEITQAARLSALITTVSLKEQQLTNTKGNKSTDKSDWWYCTWTTAASDFKTRKFKCTGTEYDEITGYVNKIKFEEVDKK